MRDVALRKTLSEYCEARDRVRALYSHGRKALEDAEAMMRESIPFGITGNAQPRDSESEVMRSIDSRFWRHALDLTNLSTIMDATAMSKFREQLGTASMPEFTIDAVQATFLDMFQRREEMFGRGCWEVFRKIRPGRWVSNDKEPFAVGKGRLILGFWFETCGWGASVPRVNYRQTDTVNDIDRIFHVLDGKTATPRGLESAMNGWFKENPDEAFENEYFRVRAFANGNAHIWFLRPDLVDKLNSVIAAYCGGNAVPDATQYTRHQRRATERYEAGVRPQ